MILRFCFYALFYFLFFQQLPAQTNTSVLRPTPWNQVFQPMKFRSVGPFRGGRSVCASGVPGNITTYFMGTTGGGLWKTDDMGITWKNCSDGFFKTGSVGAIAVSESDPNIVYVGMGEHAPRGVMTHHGDGVYKSTDGGKTWLHTGLQTTQHIARIVIDPKNPDLIFVAAQGSLYSPSKNRGVYKSSDGGKTWKNVLYINEQTGCAELSQDYKNPRIIYAAMWEHGRKPWQVISGGAGSGLYKSTDGGESWNKLKKGLPEKLGKMSVVVCRSNPEKVYALIESDSNEEAGGLFVSDDSGDNWSRVSDDHRLIQRAWYYIEMAADPNNDQVVYVLSAPALRSKDGGKSWEVLNTVHGDHHDLWINPQNSNNMILSDDGGSVITMNGGKTWSAQNNMPTAQFYRINVDNSFPYCIYGGQQDNSSVRIAHREFGSYGIGTSSWSASAGGESAFLAFDPNNPQWVMGGSYQGTIEWIDTKAKTGSNIMAAPIQYLGRDAKDMKYRFNWNAPIIRSMREPNSYFHGAQLLLKTTDFGKTWKEISPDLTRNEKDKQGTPGIPYTNEAVGAENYGTLAYVQESPHETGVLYTGSDDGLLHLTKDGGKNWQNVTPAGLKECLINAIDVSPHDKACVYIATTRYKFNDHTPGLYKSTDYGKTWLPINTGIASNAFTRVVREDPVRKGLLFAGTELGLYVSYDGGKQWESFQLNLPITPITDLRIHQNNLIVSTSGRSFWILDDLELLRSYSADPQKLTLFKPKEVILSNSGSELDYTDSSFNGTNPYRGVNPASGMVLYYYITDRHLKDTITLSIKDVSGKIIRSFSSLKDASFESYDGGPSSEPLLSVNKGINRFVWNLRTSTLPGVPNVYIEGSYAGHKVPPGSYIVELKAGDDSVAVTGVVVPNPLYVTDGNSYADYHVIMSDMEMQLASMHTLINQLYKKRAQLNELIKSGLKDEKQLSLKKKGEALLKDLNAWDEEMIQRKSKAYDDVENYPNKFSANYLFLINQTENDLGRINASVLSLKKDLDQQWEVLKNKGLSLKQRLIEYSRELMAAEIGALWKD